MKTVSTSGPTARCDFLSLGALVHRLDPGTSLPQGDECAIHVSGGEFNWPPTSPTASA